MGASASSTAVDIVNESIVNVLVRTSQNTNAYIEASQNINLSGFNLGLSFKQNLATSVTALQQVNVDMNVIDKITQEIKAKAEAKGVMLNPAIAVSDINIRNILAINLTNEVVQSCVSGIKAQQTIDTSGVNIGVIASSTVESLSKCGQINETAFKVARNIFSDVTGNSYSESKGLFEGLFGSSFMYIIIALFLLILVGVIVKVAVSRKRMEPYETQAMDQMEEQGMPVS
jgi:hypothetical protein